MEPEPESLIAKYNIYQTQHKFRENSGKITMERGGNLRRKKPVNNNELKVGVVSSMRREVPDINFRFFVKAVWLKFKGKHKYFPGNFKKDRKKSKPPKIPPFPRQNPICRPLYLIKAFTRYSCTFAPSSNEKSELCRGPLT